MAPDVSDHALVRFLERAAGLDTAALKRAIAESLARAAGAAGAIGAQRCTVHADGLVYVVIDGVVVTVLPADAPGVSREAVPPPMTQGLPELYREIAEAAGFEAARALAEAKAGQRIYIPKNLPRAGWLVALIGEKPARKLIEAFGGVEIVLPTNPFGERGQWGRVRRIHRLLDEGRSANQIVASEGCGFSSVRYHQGKRKDRDKDQPDLFGKR